MLAGCDTASSRSDPLLVKPSGQIIWDEADKSSDLHERDPPLEDHAPDVSRARRKTAGNLLKVKQFGQNPPAHCLGRFGLTHMLPHRLRRIALRLRPRGSLLTVIVRPIDSGSP